MTRITAFSRPWFLLVSGCVATAMLAVSTSANPPDTPARFFALGDLSGGATISYAYGLSGSGDVIAGESFSARSQVHGEGVHWERVSDTSWQMTAIGLPADALNSPAAGVSRDGGWIVGRASFASASPIDTDAYRWRPSTGFESLGAPPGFVLAAALGANKHGDLIVGYGGPNASYTSIRALAWRRTRSSWQIETIEGEYDSMAVRVDPRGKIAIGWASSPAAGPSGREAAYWTRKPRGTWQRHWLGALPSTAFNSQATGIARIGSKRVIIGFSGDFFDVLLPVTWSVSGNDPLEMAQLPLLPGFTSGSANAISKNGSRIVGNCWDADFNFKACVWDWDGTSGSYVASDLQERLSALGVTEAEEWSLWHASGVSADGIVICGSGTNPLGNAEAWVVDLHNDTDGPGHFSDDDDDEDDSDD